MRTTRLPRAPAWAPWVFLLACRAAPDTGPGPDADADADADADSDTDADTDADSDTDTGSAGVPVVRGVDPPLADTEGGGGRVVIEVEDTTGVVGAWLGDAALTDLVVEDATRLSGVPAAHAPGVVDVVVRNAAGSSTTGNDAFEYWTPAQIAELDAWLDAGRGLEDTDGAVSAWEDQGPNGRRFVQDDPTRRPSRVEGGFGTLPAVRFVPQQYVALDASVDLSAEGTSIFAVARWTATTDAVPPPGSNGNAPLTIVGDNRGAYGAFGARGGTLQSNHYVGGPYLVEGGADLNDGVARLVGATYDTSTTTRIYVGTEQQGVDDVGAPLVGGNWYDTIGAGYPGADGWDGDLGAVVIVSGVIDPADLVRLDLWARQRFGTPASPALDGWTRARVGTMPDDWYTRDGAQIVELASGRLLMIGGWNPYDPFGDGDRLTNEVWASDDRGESWTLLLPHDPDAPTEGPGARFPPGHTVGVTTWRGEAVVVGADCLNPPLNGDVWRSSDDGETWTRVSTTAPTVGRCLHLVGNLGDDLYVMGGQANLYEADTAIADAWRSSDGGETWTRLDDPPWTGRGMVYRPVELDGRLFVVGGGRYDAVDVVAYNGVYAYDGTAWTTVLPDGHDQFEASYYNALATAQGRLWLLNGYSGASDLSRALYSDDAGATWTEYPGGAGGRASHADAVVGLADRVLRVSGDLGAREVWGFFPAP